MNNDEIILNQDSSLSEVLDRIIDTGVVIQGDATIGVADVELIYLGLRVVLCSADRVLPPEGLAGTTPPPQQRPSPPTLPPSPPKTSTQSKRSAASQELSVAPRDEPTSQKITDTASHHGAMLRVTDEDAQPLLPSPTDDVPRDTASSLAQLVLSLVALLKELMEKQAIRRMDRDTLTDEQLEQLGTTFMELEERLQTLTEIFGLTPEDLNLDLGPLGNLLD